MFLKLLTNLTLSLLTIAVALPAKGNSEENNAPPVFLLITGCARSGTGYISHVLQKNGLDIGHESMGRDGISSWVMAIMTDEPAWGPIPSEVQFEHIFHQVRDPLKVISSVYISEPQISWDYIIKNIPEINLEDSKAEKTAKYWYYWNLRADERAEWTYRVEALDEVWEEMEARLGLSLDRSSMNQVPKNYNTRESHPFTWASLREALTPDTYMKVRTLAQFYGYVLPVD